MKKEIIVTSLVVVMSMALIGCGNKITQKETNQNTTKQVETETTTEFVEPTTEDLRKKSVEVFNKDNVLVTFAGIDEKYLYFNIKNNTKKNVKISGKIAFNGVMLPDIHLYETAKKKKETHCKIKWKKAASSIDATSLEDIKNIKCHIYLMDGKSGITISSGDIKLIDLGNPNYRYEYKEKGKIAFNKDGIEMYFEKMENVEDIPEDINSDFLTDIKLNITNESENSIICSSFCAMFNGERVDFNTSLAIEVFPHCISFNNKVTTQFYKTDQIKKIQFLVSGYDADKDDVTYFYEEKGKEINLE